MPVDNLSGRDGRALRFLEVPRRDGTDCISKNTVNLIIELLADPQGSPSADRDLLGYGLIKRDWSTG
jgi:hypothetical protein